jgi:hypothetical protein
MSNFAKYAVMDLRLVLLRCLLAQPAYKANDSILQFEAKAFGLERSRDVIRNELRWLSEVDAVKLEDLGAVLVATLTRRGQEHVQGLTQIEGVNKPSPEA